MTRLTATLGLALLLAGIGATVNLPAQSRADIDLRKAIETETVKGDLKKAIEQYRKLADGKDRSVAVQALLRMARVYELQGDAEARKVYERIIAQFKDQKDAVEKARVQLSTTLSKPAGPAQHLVWDVPRAGPARVGVVSPEASAGSVSSDGRYVCYTMDTNEASYLAVRDVASGTDRVLTNAPKADSSEGCSFSPSGDQIAYTWHAPDPAPDWEVRVVGIAEGAIPRTLLHETSRWFGTPAWSSDGRSIAVQAVRGNEREGQTETILVAIRDRSTRRLPTPGSGRMFFSPDGRYLALDRRAAGSTGQRDVFVLSMDGDREVNVTEYPSDDFVMGWSPDSSRVLVASDRNGPMGLYAVSIAGGSRQGAPTLLRGDLGDPTPMGVTTTGALHYHTRSGGPAFFLQTIDCDSSTARCLDAPVTLAAANRMALAWSPDGAYIAYLSSPTVSSSPTLKIRSVDGGSIRELPTNDLPLGGTVRLSWSPDGHALAVATMMGGRLSLIDVEGARARVTWGDRVEGGPIDSLAWSADGRKVYYRLSGLGRSKEAVLMERDMASHKERELIRRTPPGLAGWSLSPDGQSVWVSDADADGQTFALLAVPLAGGEPRAIARRLNVAGGVNISPDGRYVAIASRIPGSRDNALVVIATDGSPPRELVRVAPPSQLENVIWTQDSSTLYFRRRADTVGLRAELWQVAIDGSDARRVEGAPDLDMGLPVALSPNGRRLAFIRGDRGEPVKSEIWKLENFLPASTAK